MELKPKSHYLHVVGLGGERQQIQGLLGACKVNRYYIHTVPRTRRARE